jgi:hypothetical protein
MNTHLVMSTRHRLGKVIDQTLPVELVIVDEIAFLPTRRGYVPGVNSDRCPA